MKIKCEMELKQIEKEDDLRLLVDDLVAHLPESLQLLNIVKLSLIQDGIERKIFVPSSMTTSSLAVVALEPLENPMEDERYWSMFCARPEGLENLQFLLNHLIDWGKDQKFGGVDSGHINLLKELYGLSCDQWTYTHCHIYSPWSENLTPKFQFSSIPETSAKIPDNYLIRPVVDPSTTSLICSTWKHQDKSSQDMITKLITLGRVLAVYNSKESPIGWMSMYGQGSLGW